MTFEAALEKLAAKNVFIDHLGQIEDGKQWSATVRKKGTTNIGYGTGRSFHKAIDAALAAMRDRLDPTTKHKKKRNRLG